MKVHYKVGAVEGKLRRMHQLTVDEDSISTTREKEILLFARPRIQSKSIWSDLKESVRLGIQFHYDDTSIGTKFYTKFQALEYLKNKMPLAELPASNLQFSEAAIYAINGDYETYPKTWPEEYREVISGYDDKLDFESRLVLAQVLLDLQIKIPYN